MCTAVVLALALLASLTFEETGVASFYRPWVKGVWRRGVFIPYKRTGQYAGRWRVKPTSKDMVCAHRSLPFGTLLVLVPVAADKRPAYCVVLDRGPWGACVKSNALQKVPQCKQGERYVVHVNRRPPVGGRFRGVLDVTEPVRRMMGGAGHMVKVHVLVVAGFKRRKVLREGEGIFGLFKQHTKENGDEL